jgi:ribonuclease HII
VQKRKKQTKLEKAKRKQPAKAFEPLETELSRGLVAGADEAGRGAYAGPLAVGFVVFTRETLQNLPEPLQEVNDSKQLSARRRSELAGIIRSHALFSAVVYMSNRRIDREGINVCTERALLYALLRSRAAVSVEMVLMDGRFRFERLGKEIPYKTIIEGDARVFSIAAASILAKEGRDRRMMRYAEILPGWEFERNKGYGTSEHRHILEKRDPGPLHRRSFNIVPEPMLDFGDT